MTDTIIMRGAYAITDPRLGASGVIPAGAVVIMDGTVKETGPFAAIAPKYPGADIIGDGTGSWRSSTSGSSAPIRLSSATCVPSLPTLTMDDSAPLDRPRHSVLVRVTHWITTFSFVGLLVSGIAILLAHPRLYWGETGGVGAPSLVDLPLPFVFVDQTGWGRSLHFLCAWISVATGLTYVVSGIFTQHFRTDLLPAKGDLSWRSISRVVSNHLHLGQRRQQVVQVLLPPGRVLTGSVAQHLCCAEEKRARLLTNADCLHIRH